MATFTGTAQGEYIHALYGVSSTVVVNPTGGIPGAAVDLIHGNGGDDIIDGGGGNDEIYAGAGNDTAYGGDRRRRHR